MVVSSSLQTRVLSSFVRDRFICSTPPVRHLFRFDPGPKFTPLLLDFVVVWRNSVRCSLEGSSLSKAFRLFPSRNRSDALCTSFGNYGSPSGGGGEELDILTGYMYETGSKHVSMQLSRSLSGLTDLLFNRRNEDVPDGKRKRLRPGKISPCRPVPDHILRPPYIGSRQPPGIASGPEVHDEKGIECMRASGKLAAQVLEFAGTLVEPGIRTDEIDQAVHQMIIDNGAYPSPLGYGGFPKSVCTSVNECICHGIPDSRELEDGDIINIDVTVYLNGYHGDTSATFFCGEVDDEAKTLVQVTKEGLYKAISVCAPGVEFKKIGRTIHDHADKYGYGVVRQFVGHGVGRMFHADPVILHFRNNEGGRMVLNQTFTIEPMLTIGSINPVMWDDNWTVVTEDGSLSAQFEHTILITKDGAEVLTQC